MNQPISSLDLTDNIIGRLQKNGFHYCHDFKENCENIPQKIHVSNWPSLTEAPSSKTALELLREEIHWQPITTFVPELDSLLKHEISPNMITELSGFPGTGKTQICFHLSVGVNEGETFFISTNKNFASHRLREIAQKCVSDMESALKRIYCVEATDPVELLASVKFLESWLPSHNHVRLLIIDSISWPLKQKPHTERASLIHTIFQNLRILASKYKFA
ncbi:DNA repair protein RAD51 -like 3, partial [Asbolus verrucosus]